VTLVYCGQTVGWIKIKLDMQVNLGPGHIVLDRDPAPLPKGPEPQFPAHVCCGQTAGWIKMPLGTEVDLGPGLIVLDGDQVSPRKGHSSPSFCPMSIVAKRSAISATAEHLLRYVSGQIYRQTDIQYIYRHAHRNTSHPYTGGGAEGEVTTPSTCSHSFLTPDYYSSEINPTGRQVQKVGKM